MGNLAPQTYQERLSLEAEDAMSIISALKIADIRNERVIDELYSRGMLSDSDSNRTLVDVMGWMWATQNQTYLEAAGNITEEILTKVMPRNMQWELQIENDIIYNTTLPEAKGAVSVGRRIVSGYMKSQPFSGYTAKVYMKKIDGKRTAAYIFFGGFVGEGNITTILSELPSDASVKSIYMEMNTASNFSLFINNYPCGIFNKYSADYIPVDNWTITNQTCLNKTLPGQRNNFTISFVDIDLAKNYIGGGYIKVSYETSMMLDAENYSRFYLPGIDGIINYYDSFYVPGNISAMDIHLELYNNYTTYMNIGNVTIFNSTGNQSTQIVDIENSTLRSLLNYSKLSNANIPIHMISQLTNITGIGNADVVLITDLSESMNWRMDSDATGVTRNNCSDPLLYASSTKRISLAKCLDKEFIDVILNSTGNRVALVGFYADSGSPYKGRVYQESLTSNSTYLKSKVNIYVPQGGTCICCAENTAYKILNEQSNSSREKYVVVMSDGIPTHTCQAASGCTGTRTGLPSDEGLWLGYGAGCYGGSDDCDSNDCNCAITNANWSSCRLNTYLNATVDSIGFGPVSTCNSANRTLTSIATCGNGSYYASSDAHELADIYGRIATTIANQSFVKQTVSITGNVSYSRLYPNSYIQFDYQSNIFYGDYQNISIRLETDPLPSCNGSFFVPQQMQVSDAKVTSYSGDYWTHEVYFTSSDTWTNIFRLGNYGSSYLDLGDPYSISIPEGMVASNATNSVDVKLGTSPTNTSTYCSSKNRVVYTARIKSSVPYGENLPRMSGFNVSVYYDNNHDGLADGYVNVAVGTGVNFNSTLITVDQLQQDDALHDAFLRLLDQLNFLTTAQNSGRPGSANNPIDIKLSEVLDVDYTSMANVPYFWGPVDVNINVWA
ncbi:MAG: VWA domain-containing protein [Candidatus Aenigmarchaeota archaeon]|nr:VWA domain-containing protein [Candidatus Aenigmarchaeota archaeon]